MATSWFFAIFAAGKPFGTKLKLSVQNLSKIAFLVLLLCVSSCVSRKKTITPPPTSFEWMIANMSIQAEGNGLSYNDLSGQIRMRRDSIVWFSVTAAVGVEVLRAKVSADSVWVLNRLEKSYLAESLDTISVQLGIPISLQWLQTMLLDNIGGAPPVENQTVQLKNFAFGHYSAKIKYNNVKLDKKTTFPLRITDKMERISIKSRDGE